MTKPLTYHERLCRRRARILEYRSAVWLRVASEVAEIDLELQRILDAEMGIKTQGPFIPQVPKPILGPEWRPLGELKPSDSEC